MKKVRMFIRQLVDIIKRPYMKILPGQLAFFSLMSLIPLIALIGSIANYLSFSTDTIKETAGSFLPLDLTTMFGSQGMTGRGLNFNIVIFFITAFLLASNGMHSVIITTNEIYNIEDQGFFGRRIKAIAMTFVIVGLLFFLLVVTVFGGTFFNVLRQYSTNIDAVEFLATLFEYLKLPISIALIFLNIRQLYRMAPDSEIFSKTPTYAAVFTTIIWILGTEIYSIYVRYFANYNLFYGSISNIIILMVWIYFLAYVFVLGMGLSTIDIEKLIGKKEIKKEK